MTFTRRWCPLSFNFYWGLCKWWRMMYLFGQMSGFNIARYPRVANCFSHRKILKQDLEHTVSYLSKFERYEVLFWVYCTILSNRTLHQGIKMSYRKKRTTSLYWIPWLQWSDKSSVRSSAKGRLKICDLLSWLYIVYLGKNNEAIYATFMGTLPTWSFRNVFYSRQSVWLVGVHSKINRKDAINILVP